MNRHFFNKNVVKMLHFWLLEHFFLFFGLEFITESPPTGAPEREEPINGDGDFSFVCLSFGFCLVNVHTGQILIAAADHT